MPEPLTPRERSQRLFRLQFDLIYLMNDKTSERLRQARKLLNDEYKETAAAELRAQRMFDAEVARSPYA